MGHEIVYCAKCQSQLRGTDFEKGKAVRKEAQVYCSGCAPAELLAPDPPPLPVPIKPGSSGRIPHLGLPSKPARRSVASQSRGSLVLIGLGAAGIVIGLVVVLAVAAGGPSPPARGAPEAAKAPTLEPAAEPSKPPPEPRRLPVAPEAPRAAEAETAQKKEREALAAELAALDEEVRAACANEEFQRALAVLQKAAPRHPGAEWAMWIEKRAADVRKQPENLYGALKEQALAARRRGAAADVRAVTERVARWGIHRLRDELANALADAKPAPAPPEPPAPPPDAKLLQAHWEAAAALAEARDYAAAIAELERALASIRDPAVRAEAAADLELFRQAAAVLSEALQALSKRPKGQKAALDFFDEAAHPRRIEGTVAKADAHRMEVKAETETVIVEFGEVLAGSLADALKEKTPRKAGLGLLCLLEGDLEGARRHPADVPEKYGTHARKAAESRANPREQEARALFHVAAKETGNPPTAADAIQKFQSLLKDHAGTSFVRRNRSSIAARAELGREFLFFAPDMSAGGGFRLARNSRGESSWTTEPDSDPGRPVETYLSDLGWTSATNGWGPVEKDKSNGNQAAGDGKTLTLNGTTYPKGLGMHAAADVKFALGGKYTAFVAEVGVDDAAGPGSVVFQVWADGAVLFDSGVMRQETAAKAVNVSVVGKQELRLVVADAGDGVTCDEANWGGARLLGPPPSLKGSYLELEFSVLPDKEYRLWLYAGGCCAEGLALQAQATDLVAPHPATQEPAPAEPGGEFSVPVKHGLSFATRAHSGHAPRKEPVRWGWIPVPLPRYATAGPKKVRLLAEQKGFWMGYAFVSALRAAPPRESEVKELEKARPEAAPRPPAEKGAGLAIANTSPKAYVWDVADVGKTQYVDRDFKISSGPPALVGLRFLRTANEDKSSRGDSFITFDVNQPVTVLVAHDDRIAPRPAWLAAFGSTGEKIVSGAGTFSVFAKDFPAGRVTLGGNTADGAGSGRSMYSVAIRPRGTR